MDRNQVIGIILITIVMMAWMFYMAPSADEIERMERERAERDTLQATEQVEDTLELETPDPETPEFRPGETRPDFGIFDQTTFADTILTRVETPFFHMDFTNLGAGPSRIELQRHRRWDEGNVQLIADTLRSAYNIGFLSAENYNIETSEILFRPLQDVSHISIGAGETATLAYALELEDGRSLVLEYTFNGDSYEMELEITFNDIRELFGDSTYELTWLPRLRTTERSRSQEAEYAGAFAYVGGTLDRLRLRDQGRERESYTGNIEWVSTKTKFFTQILKPLQETDGAILTGEFTGSNDNVRTHYTSTLRSIVPFEGETNRYRMFVGPLDNYKLRDFDRSAYDMVETGFRFIRWFSDPFVKWVVLPFFNFFGGMIPNTGLVIVLFALVIKIVLYPLTKKSFESMAAMRELQPEMKAIQEKYKDNPQAQQQATMKLFKKAKVNPLGGCLPNLLQAPVLISLWRYFQNAIEIRQESFLWAQDLSAPDPIIHLPFSVPFMGDFIGGFVLLMAGSMVLQMKISGQGAAANPQMKIFQYVLPVFLFFFFNQFASGLSLYYLIYNTLSIGQQMLINKQIDHVKMMETVDKKKAKQMAREKKKEEQQKLKEARNKKQ